MRVRSVLAVTMGDPAGIGPELCLRALGNDEVADAYVIVVFGDVDVLERASRASGVPWPMELSVVSKADWEAGHVPHGPTVVDSGAIDGRRVEPGQVCAACGQAAYRYIEIAAHAALAERVRAVVTAPINKEALGAAGIAFPGHTEILGELTGATSYCMMLTSRALTVSFSTTHMALASVSTALTPSRIQEVIRLTAGAISVLSNKQKPRIGVCGLNPHAGEHGLFGNEEAEVIEPAILSAREEGIEVSGPLAPDTAFASHVRSRYDAIVCMYHDQGHIPFKMLAFEKGVNVTLGLPIVRTSVDHGTAFDIAWQGKAKPTSLLEALRIAARLAEGRSLGTCS